MPKPQPPIVKEVLAMLSPLGTLRARAMFGGYGLYCNNAFFALVAGERIFFRVTEETRPDYACLGSRAFCPNPEEPERVMNGYYEVPASIYADAVQFREWASRAADR